MFVFFWRLFYIFKKLCRVVKTLPPLIKLFSFNRQGFLQNLEKTKKTKNQNFLEKFWFQAKRCFFWFSLSFFCFFWFRFLKTKKYIVFLFFLVRCLEYMYEQSMKKPKNLEFFCFLPFFNKDFLPKTKKTSFFL